MPFPSTYYKIGRFEELNMLDGNYFQSLSQELHSLKSRVWSFIRDRHWQTDGEWKESVVRAVLRRHLPKSGQIGRGFVITNDDPSNQIDILIYDSTRATATMHTLITLTRPNVYSWRS